MKTLTVNILLLAALQTCVATNEQTSAAAASKDLTASDGKVYQNAEILRADPDGLIVSYQAEKKGIALAKVRFANLPDSIRTKYGYDAEKSAAFATNSAGVSAQWRDRQNQVAATFSRYRALAELNRSLAGDGMVSYSVSIAPDGSVSAQGFTEAMPPYSYAFPAQNGAAPNYPLQNSQMELPGNMK